MSHLLKRTGLAMALLMSGAASVFGFALLGPSNEPYQDPIIGYDFAFDIGAPKNKGEEYRWNTKYLYYACDATFLDYFGSNGLAAVDGAFAILNNLTNMSSYSADLSEFPLGASRVNYRASALSLVDVKSALLSLLVEQLGLAEPDRYTWGIHQRVLPTGGVCPQDEEYFIIKRNFDPVTYEYSSFVNSTLYTYTIQEFCTGPNPLADAVEIPVDLTSESYSAVASSVPANGVFFTGLTRDDVGGLRFLIGTNRVHVESVETNSLLRLTNSSQLLFTSNLAQFVEQSLTNNAGALQALYPDLVILNTTNYFTNVITTNIFAYFTNFPYAPANSFATLVLGTNYTTNAQVRFLHTFANVFTNLYFTSRFGTVLQTNVTVGQKPFGYPGQLQTNNLVTSTTTYGPGISGDFYILPASNCAPYQILSTQLVNLVTITNSITIASNAVGTTNVNGQAFTQDILSYFTNYVFVVYPVICVTNSVDQRRGVDKITFIRRDYDGLTGTFWRPIDTNYTLTAITTNNSEVSQMFQRHVVRPDFVIGAEDTLSGPGGNPGLNAAELRRSIIYNTNQTLLNLAGPGTIVPPVRMTYNKVGPVYLNPNVFFLPPLVKTEQTQLLIYQWGSFDGTTNDPVVYPSSTSLANLENQIVMQVTTGALPNGNVGVAYAPQQLTAAGGSPPYSWSLATNSPALPGGLTISAVGVISGTPTNSGVFDFVVQAADAGLRITQRNLSIEIDP